MIMNHLTVLYVNVFFFFSFQTLTAVQFSSKTLTSLSLDGCRAIKSLVLKCPHLEKVSLDGCDHLERAEFCPVSDTEYLLLYLFIYFNTVSVFRGMKVCEADVILFIDFC